MALEKPGKLRDSFPTVWPTCYEHNNCYFQSWLMLQSTYKYSGKLQFWLARTQNTM